MKPLPVFILLALLVPSGSCRQAEPAPTGASDAVRYGANSAAGSYFTHDGVRLYLPDLRRRRTAARDPRQREQHWRHGGADAYFREHYQVIAMDSRDHGRSADSPEKLTYEKMTDDLAALLDHLKLRPVNVLGWSDGAIEALLLGIRHPTKVKKIAAMAANLNPTEEAVYAEVIGWVKQGLAAFPQTQRDTPDGRRARKVTAMMLEEPHIDATALEAITAPTLVLAGDHDVIRDEHTLEIYHRLPNSQLAIFPNATHRIPYDDPDTFNATVERFFRTPFVKKDRIRDFVKSIEKSRAEARNPK